MWLRWNKHTHLLWNAASSLGSKIFSSGSQLLCLKTSENVDFKSSSYNTILHASDNDCVKTVIPKRFMWYFSHILIVSFPIHCVSVQILMDLTVFDNFSLVQIIGWDQRGGCIRTEVFQLVYQSSEKNPNTNNQRNAEWVQFNRLNNSITIKNNL